MIAEGQPEVKVPQGRNFLFPRIDYPNIVGDFSRVGVRHSMGAGFVVEGGSDDRLGLFSFDELDGFFEAGARVRDIVDDEDLFVFNGIGVERGDELDFFSFVVSHLFGFDFFELESNDVGFIKVFVGKNGGWRQAAFGDGDNQINVFVFELFS